MTMEKIINEIHIASNKFAKRRGNILEGLEQPKYSTLVKEIQLLTNTIGGAEVINESVVQFYHPVHHSVNLGQRC